MRPPLFAILLAAALAACAPAISRTDATPRGAVSPDSSSLVPIPTLKSDPLAAGPSRPADALTPIAERALTIGVVVASVAADGAALALAGENEGFKEILLTPDTRIVRADGEPGAVADLRAGQTVRVMGLPGKAGALIAQQVTVVGED